MPSLLAQGITFLLKRQTTVEVDCDEGNDYDGRMGLRVSAIFVILVGSFFGGWFPIFAARHRGVGVPDWAFFVAKYFGSGVIVATAFIHLLAPASDALTSPCLSGPITEYDWAEGIALMTIFVLFFIELMTMRYAKFGHSHGDEHDHELGNVPVAAPNPYYDEDPDDSQKTLASSPGKSQARNSVTEAHESGSQIAGPSSRSDECPTAPHARGDDHLGHVREHTDNEDVSRDWASPASEKNIIEPESYAAQLTAVFILEFGVIFHSIFIGLTLAVAGDEFITLYIVLCFHQTFEGLGLGTRLAAIPWPKSKRWTPYFLAIGYAVSTPIAIAIGLGVRTTYPANGATTTLVNGVFDSLSAGVLIYTGLVELMAHEFMFSTYMQRASIKTVLAAFGMMALGAGLMALLGKWA